MAHFSWDPLTPRSATGRHTTLFSPRKLLVSQSSRMRLLRYLYNQLMYIRRILLFTVYIFYSIKRNPYIKFAIRRTMRRPLSAQNISSVWESDFQESVIWSQMKQRTKRAISRSMCSWEEPPAARIIAFGKAARDIYSLRIYSIEPRDNHFASIGCFR